MTKANTSSTSKPTEGQAEAKAKPVNLNQPTIQAAIKRGQELIKAGKTKVEAAMSMFETLEKEEREVIVAAFIKGANLTEKGAITYFYNCRRKAKKQTK